MSESPVNHPSRTDRLTLIQQLSGGSIGVVYKAKSPKQETLVALRQFQVPEWLDNVDDLLKKILGEARSANALHHPNIALLHSGGYKGFTVFLTAEFIEGPTLREYAINQRPGMADLLPLAAQLCAALDYAHSKGVFHHCLTPSNLKVMADGTLKALDFGLLRDKDIYAPTPAKRLENEHYTSPEQLKGGAADRGANLFTAASIFYEMFTTRHPFSGKHLGEVDKNITDVEPHPLNLVHPRVSEAVSKVILKALSKRRLDRFQSATDLAAALEEAANPSSVKAAAKPAAPITKPAPPSVAPAAPISARPVAAPSPNVPSPSAPSPAAPAMSAGPVAMAAAPALDATVRIPVSPAQPPSKPSAAMGKAGVSEAGAKKPVRRMSAKEAQQWKLLGIGGLVLVVAAMVGMALAHRGPKIQPPETVQAQQDQQTQPAQDASSTQAQQPTADPASPQAATSESTPWLAVDESQPKGRRAKQAKQVAVASAPAAAPGANSGQLAITSTPPGATVEIAERPGESWKTPQTISFLAPGSYKVTWSKVGFATETRTIQIAGGGRANLDLNLTPTKGYVKVAGTPAGAHILIDGKDTGKVSPADFVLDPAVHNIIVHQDGYLDSATELKVVAGQTANFEPAMKLAGRTDNIKVVNGGLKKVFGGNSSEGMTVVQIKTVPKGAQIVINGDTFSRTTPVDIQLEPGNYEISLQKDGYKPVHKSISAEPNAKIKIEEQLSAQ